MIDSGPGFLLYALIKYGAYVAWCYAGLRLFERAGGWKKAAGYGLLRLVLGIFFGVGVFLLGGMLHLQKPAHPFALYLEMYVPVRWIEWSIVAMLLAGAASSGSDFLIGSTYRDRAWRLAGILVSIAADLPLILSGEGVRTMLPIGRFLC